MSERKKEEERESQEPPISIPTLLQRYFHLHPIHIQKAQLGYSEMPVYQLMMSYKKMNRGGVFFLDQ